MFAWPVEKLPSWLPGAWFVQYIRGACAGPHPIHLALRFSSDIKPFLKNLIDFPIERIQRQMVYASVINFHTLVSHAGEGSR